MVSNPYPKILTELTLASALQLRMKVHNGGSFNLDVDATIAAGSYYMRWDGQDDDFYRALHLACYTALDACAAAGYNGSDLAGKPMFRIDADHHTRIAFAALEAQIDWTALDGAAIAAILGFAGGSVMTFSDSDYQISEYQHAYGWYASDSGQLAAYRMEDDETTNAAQSRAIGGEITTQYLGSAYDNKLDLAFLLAEDVYSRGKSYTEAPLDPYGRNRGLECWWREARQGIPFCVYEDAKIAVALAEDRGATDVAIGTPTTIEVTGKTWETDPQRHAGKLVLVLDWDGVQNPMRYLIGSHDANTITVPNSVHNTDAGGVANTAAYVFDQRYRTYVLDVIAMRKFSPIEVRATHPYDISIPLLRYVA